MCCVMSWKRLCIMKLLIDYRRPTNQESLCSYWNLYTGYFVSLPTRTTQRFALAFIIEIAVINRLHCLICHFRALWGDHGMLTLTLNLLLQNEVLWIVEIKWKKHENLLSCHIPLHWSMTSQCQALWRPSFLKYEAWKMPSSACFMEVISCIHYNFEVLPCSTTLQLVTIVELNDNYIYAQSCICSS